MRRGPGIPSASPALLEKYRKEILKCVRCGACRAVCPSFFAGLSETLSPRGRIALIRAALAGKLPVSYIYRDRLATCMGCLACVASCPCAVPVNEIVQAAKDQAVREAGRGFITAMISGVLSHEQVLRSLAWLAPAALHYDRVSVTSAEGIHLPTSGSFLGTEAETILSGRGNGRIGLFVGCAINYFQQDIARATVSVLLALGYDVVIPKSQRCCGRPLLSLGDVIAAEETARHNAALFEGLGVDAVVTACASCGLTFKREYNKLLPAGNRMPAFLDIHEVMFHRLSELKLSPVNLRIAYHDPCHLGRGQGLTETARAVLGAVPGLKLADIRNPGRCCGFGGVMRVFHRDISDRVGETRAGDIISSNAETAVTGCPGCRMQLLDSLRRAGSDAKVVHTVQVVEKALRSEESVNNKILNKIGRILLPQRH